MNTYNGSSNFSFPKLTSINVNTTNNPPYFVDEIMALVMFGL